MTTAHRSLTGASLHEPKGVETATANQVYKADGAGSGSWQTLTIPTGLFTVTITNFTATGTWTKPANLFKVRVHVIGSGGNGIDANATGTTGGSTSFGAHCSATGGTGGVGGSSTGGVGGAGSSGSLNLTGGSGVGSTTPGASCMGGLGGGMWMPKGQGGSVSSAGGGQTASGGGGGYSMKEIAAAALGSTETVTINTAGQNNGFVLVEEYISV